MYSWLPITRTLANLPLTRSSFCFPSGHFYIILPSITRTIFIRVTSRKKKQSSEVRNVQFISKQPCQFLVFFVIPVQVQCPSLYVNQASFLNFFFKILIYISCCSWKWSVHDTCIPSPSIHLRIFLFPVICFELAITRIFFNFPRRFELLGVDSVALMK